MADNSTSYSNHYYPGERGIQGERGDIGPPGNDGVNGVNGVNGLDGQMGKQGPVGRYPVLHSSQFISILNTRHIGRSQQTTLSIREETREKSSHFGDLFF